MMLDRSDALRSFCTFRLNGHLFGFDMLDVKEVTTAASHTPVDLAPDEVMGLVNIRGHIYLILDPRLLLGLTASPLTSDCRLMLFKPAVGSAFGVVVESIAEIHMISPDEIAAFNPLNQDSLTSQVRRVDLISAVCQLPGELLVILNPRRFLPVVEQEFTLAT